MVGEFGRKAKLIEYTMASEDHPALAFPLRLLELAVFFHAEVEEVPEVRVEAGVGELVLSFRLDALQTTNL